VNRALLALVALAAMSACEPEAPRARSNSSTAEAKAKCEHGVVEALCTKHHPELVPVFKSQNDWCDEHGLPRSQCTQHAAPAGTTSADGEWCQEHGVAESHCTKCHPALVATFIAKGDYCREHGFPESVCPVCHPELPAKSGHTPPTFPDPSTTVTLASSDTAKDAGIETTRVTKRAFAKSLEVTGELGFDGNAQAQVSTKDDARVLEVLVDVGDDVKQGQPLVVLASAGAGADRAQLASAAARLENARQALARLEQLQGITAQKNLDEAKRDVATAQADHDAAAAALRATGADVGASSGGRLVLTSPLAGTVVARDAVPGRTTSAGAVLVHVANTKTLWATLDVPEEQSTSVRAGQPVELRFDGLAHETRDATVARVGASIDAHTRTVRARVDVNNDDGRLKAGLFLRARIAVADAKDALMVPRAAVQRAEGKAIVFVVDVSDAGATLYRPVGVTLGDGDSERVQILAGLSEGDEVVTTGAFLLKTEILKGSIGAGCCD
jgi:cobalt-zinc-cadmium efflux system membrane fusion protein